MTDRDEIKQRVKDAIDLAAFIGREIPLKREGERDWKGLCPFHTEKSPSFTVFNKDGGWQFYCFGCDAKGDIFEWIMRRKGWSFPDALRAAANYAGVALPEAGERLYQPEEVRAATGKDSLQVEGSEKNPAPQKRGVFEPEKYRELTPGSAAFEYLTGKRQLKRELLEAYAVGETSALHHFATEGNAYAFAYKWRPANWGNREKACFEFCKLVKVDRPDGKKIEQRDPKGGKNILFGMEAPVVVAAWKAGGELVISEGEIDAITWAQFGLPAVSVPCGAKSTAWIDVCWDWLQKFSKIHLSFDEDAAGRGKVAEIVTRLGMARTDIVRLPVKAEGGMQNAEVKRYKDANECLQNGVTPEQMQAAVHQAEFIKPDRLKSIYEFEEEIWNKFHPSGTEQIGLTLPWGNHFGSSLPFRFRYGEVTVWTGYNKHGKSEVLNHCMVDLCWQGDKALICSLEVQAPETYRKLIRMTQARRDVARPEDRAQFAEKCLKPLADKIWVYDQVGNADIEEVMNVMLYAYQRFGVRQFVLDSLMRFSGLDGEGQEIWNAQRGFMDRLTNFAKLYNVHVHLVAHSKKPNDRKGEAIIPRRYDVMGSSYISNLAFNVIVVWRNRAKQDKLEEIFQKCEDIWVAERKGEKPPPWKRLLGGPPADTMPLEIKEKWGAMVDTLEKLAPEEREEFQELVSGKDSHDAYFIVDAQRGGDGDCPARHLWFHYDSLQFLEVSPWKQGDTRRLPKPYAQTATVEMDEEI
jgi:hypothetical protein